MNTSGANEMQDQLIIKEFGIEEITSANIKLMEKQILEIPEKPETKEQYENAGKKNFERVKEYFVKNPNATGVEISKALGLSLPAVYGHLKKLR